MSTDKLCEGANRISIALIIKVTGFIASLLLGIYAVSLLSPLNLEANPLRLMSGVYSPRIIPLVLASVAVSMAAMLILAKGFSRLRMYKTKYSIGLYGSILVLVGYVITLVLILLEPIAISYNLIVGLVFVLSLGLAGLILLVSGVVMIIISLWTLGGEPKGSLVRVGVVLWIASLALLVISILYCRSFTIASFTLALSGSIVIAIGARRIAVTRKVGLNL